MKIKHKNKFVEGLVKKDINGKAYLTLDDLYLIYDRCKLKSLVKILNEESVINFYDEDYKEGNTNNKKEYS